MSSTTQFVLPSNLQYSQPAERLSGEKQFVSFAPTGATSYSMGDSIKININSNNQFLDPARSYLRFRVRGAGTSSASHKIPVAGWAYAINRVSTHVGGVLIEDISDYNRFISLLYQKLPASHQNMLKKLESYDTQNAVAVASANGLTNGQVICHALRVALLEQPKMLPLCFVRGGIELNLYLETLNNFLHVNSDAGITGITIDQVAFVACMVKPADAYLQQFSKSLEGGAQVKIPIELCKSIRNTPVNASESSELLNVGFLKSLKSIWQASHSNTLGVSSSTSGNDSSMNYSMNGLQRYSLQVGGKKYPQNFDISCCQTVGSTTVSPEHLMQELVSVDNTYAFLNEPSGATTGSHIFYEFSNDKSWGSGIPVSDGIVSLAKVGTPTSTSVNQYTFCWHDALLKISASSCEVDSKALS
jgi:hypothetical protein